MKSISVLASLLPLAASFKYALPKSFAISADCTMPESYTIQNFTTFTATGSNDTDVRFSFADEGTSTTTTCQKNSTSVNLTPNGTPRYACDNSNVRFIWSASKLTMIEAACPGTSSAGFDASGAVIPTLTCSNCTSGAGVDCRANGTLTADYTSLQPNSSGSGGSSPGPVSRRSRFARLY